MYDDIAAPSVVEVPVYPAVPEAPAVPVEEVPVSTAPIGQTIASPSVRRPSVALRVATFPDVVYQATNAEIVANQPVLQDSLRILSPGVLTLTALLDPSASSTQVLVTVDGTHYGIVVSDDGSALATPGFWFRAKIDVVPGDVVNVQVSSEGLFRVLRLVFREGV